VNAPVLAALALCALPSAENRAFRVELELVGPLQDVVLDAGEEGRTRVVGPLREGERRRTALPVPLIVPGGLAALDSVDPALALELEVRGAGSAELLGWSEAQPAAGLADLPLGLIARPRPPVPRGPRERVAPPPSLLLACGAVSLAALLVRRRAARAALALFGGLACYALALGARAESDSARVVLEGDLAVPDPGGAWVLVAAAAGDLRFPHGIDGTGWTEGAWFDALEVGPRGARLEYELPLAPGPPAGGPRAFVVGTGTGDGLHGLSRVRFAELPLLRTENRSLDLTAGWSRSGSGPWRAHGPWPAGRPLPAALPDGVGAAPPGWLVAGLPQGAEVFCGRRLDGVWVRLSGFR